MNQCLLGKGVWCDLLDIWLESIECTERQRNIWSMLCSGMVTVGSLRWIAICYESGLCHLRYAAALTMFCTIQQNEDHNKELYLILTAHVGTI